jgi:hypothetical protein
MGGFQKIVLFSAIIILIVVLIIIGMALSYAKDEEWPPTVSDCPDYWMIDGSGNNSKCINVKDLGRCPPKGDDKHLIMNFNQGPFQGTNESCAKYRWSKLCDVTWDGISYGVTNPCQQTTE